MQLDFDPFSTITLNFTLAISHRCFGSVSFEFTSQETDILLGFYDGLDVIRGM